jgi:hypothetical protein
MRLQIRTPGTLARSTRGTPTLVFSFYIGPLEIYIVANVPLKEVFKDGVATPNDQGLLAREGSQATAYVHVELKERILIDESTGIPQKWHPTGSG